MHAFALLGVEKWFRARVSTLRSVYYDYVNSVERRNGLHHSLMILNALLVGGCLGAHAYVQLRRSIEQSRPRPITGVLLGRLRFARGDHIQVATLYLDRTQIGCSSRKTSRKIEAFPAHGR